MTIRVVPSGVPYWSRTNTFAIYGGHASKTEYAGIPALGGDTDLAAADFNRLPTDLAAVSRTLPFCVISFTPRESTSANPLVTYVAMPTGVYVGEPYDGGNPPTGFPSVELTGDYSVITFDSSYSDAYGVSASFAPNLVKVTVNKTTAAGIPEYEVSGQTIRTRVVDDGGDPVQSQSLTVEVW